MNQFLTQKRNNANAIVCMGQRAANMKNDNRDNWRQLQERFIAILTGMKYIVSYCLYCR